MKTGPTVADVDEDLLDTVTSLFPSAALDVTRSARSGFRFVPGVSRARMLVPADAPAAAAGAVDRPSANDSRRQVLRRRAVGTILRVGPLARLAMPHVLRVEPLDDSIVEYLSGVTGKDVRVSLTIGARRANRKPVLNVHTVDGTEVGYAKVGLTTLANALIDHEAAVLAQLSQERPQGFLTPRPLHHGQWRSSSVLLMESLRPTTPAQGGGLPRRAIAELTAREGIRWQRVGETTWFEGVVGVARDLTDAGSPELAVLADRYLRSFGDLEVPLGRWHGDLGPWNMAWQGETPMIWDWERSEHGVPAAMDAVHYTCHSTLRSVGDLARAREVLGGAGPQALRSTLRHVPDGARSTVGERLVRSLVSAYLLSVAARFSADALRPDGDAVEELGRWHRTVLDDQLDQER